MELSRKKEMAELVEELNRKRKWWGGVKRALQEIELVNLYNE